MSYSLGIITSSVSSPTVYRRLLGLKNGDSIAVQLPITEEIHIGVDELIVDEDGRFRIKHNQHPLKEFRPGKSTVKVELGVAK